MLLQNNNEWKLMYLSHPSLTDTFFQGFIPKSGFYIIWKLWLQRIQKYHPQNRPWSARKSSPNTFFSARVAEGNSDILFVYLFCVAEFPDGLKKPAIFLAFLKIKWLFTFFGHLVTYMALLWWWCPSFHWILRSLPIILSGNTCFGREKPD